MKDYLHGICIEESIESNFIDYWRIFCTHPEAELVETPEYLLFSTGVDFSTFNGVFGLKSDQNINESITVCLDYFASRKTAMIWRVGPYSQPSNLASILEERGLVLYAYDDAMAADLDTIIDVANPSNVEIVEVVSEKDITMFCIVLSQVFDVPEFVRDAVITSYTREINSPVYGIKHYFAKIRGVIIGVASLLISKEQVAGVYNVATVEAFRGQGTGTLLTRHCMIEAKKRGCLIAILQASPSGKSIYKKLGFADYGQYQYYLCDSTK